MDEDEQYETALINTVAANRSNYTNRAFSYALPTLGDSSRSSDAQAPGNTCVLSNRTYYQIVQSHVRTLSPRKRFSGQTSES